MNAKNGLLMAVKQVEIPSGDSHNDKRKMSMLEALEREIELLKTMQHENIVQYLGKSILRDVEKVDLVRCSITFSLFTL